MKLRYTIFIAIIFSALGAYAFHGTEAVGQNSTVNVLNPFKVVGGYILPRDVTNGLQINALVSCDTIDTDADGKFVCGTDDGGVAATSEWVNATTYLYPKGGLYVGAPYFTGTSTTASSTFLWASTTRLSATDVWLGTVRSGTWNGTSLTDAYVDDTITASNYLSLASWFGTTSAPQLTTLSGLTSFGSANATTTTLGALQIGSTAGDNLLRLTATRNHGTASLVSADGLLNITNTSNNDVGLQVYTNANSSAFDPLVVFRSDNTDFDEGLMYLIQDGTDGGAYNIRMDGPAPQIEFVETDQTSPAGKFELNVNGDIMRITSRDVGDASFEDAFLFNRVDSSAGGGFAQLGTGSSYFTGNLGIGTTSPYVKLAVNGDVVASGYTATSTTASSSFQAITGTAFGIAAKWFADATRFIVQVAAQFTAGLTVLDFLDIPSSTNPTVDAEGEIAINTTAASSSLRYFDGTAERVLSPIVERSFSFASTTLDYMGDFGAAGTTTILLMNSDRPITLTDIYCKTNTGTTSIQFSDGTNKADEIRCGPNGAEDDGTIANSTWTRREDFKIEIGSSVGTPGNITVTAGIRTDAD